MKVYLSNLYSLGGEVRRSQYLLDMKVKITRKPGSIDFDH